MTGYTRKDDGIIYHQHYGRLMEHKGYALRIYWSASMTDYLRRHFPTMLNEELAGCLGVSVRTVIRKARKMNLEKDPTWLLQVWNERRMMAHIINRRNVNAGNIRKGEHRNRDGEFKKGRKPSAEEIAKRRESMKRWYRLHHAEAVEKARKAWITRRINANDKDNR